MLDDVAKLAEIDESATEWLAALGGSILKAFSDADAIAELSGIDPAELRVSLYTAAVPPPVFETQQQEQKTSAHQVLFQRLIQPCVLRCGQTIFHVAHVSRLRRIA